MTPAQLAELHSQEVKGMTWMQARTYVGHCIAFTSPDKLDQITDYALFGIPPSVKQKECVG